MAGSVGRKQRPARRVARHLESVQPRHADVAQVHAAAQRHVERLQVRRVEVEALQALAAGRPHLQDQLAQVGHGLEQQVDGLLVHLLVHKVLLEGERRQLRQPPQCPQGSLRPVKRHNELLDLTSGHADLLKKLHKQSLVVVVLVHQISGITGCPGQVRLPQRLVGRLLPDQRGVF